MSHKRHVWETISDLASRLNHVSGDGLAKLEEQLSKLGREQYRANALAQAQAERMQAALESLQSATARLEADQREAVQKARLGILKALLPVLDGLEAGLESGERQLATLAYHTSDPAIPNAQSAIEAGQGAQAAAILAAWLDGQRLLRDRLLAILNEAGIQPVPTIGQPFDPYRHVAVGTVEDASLPDGHIVAEERRGYAAGDQVLRYAEVVVVKNRATSDNTQYEVRNTQ